MSEKVDIEKAHRILYGGPYKADPGSTSWKEQRRRIIEALGGEEEAPSFRKSIVEKGGASGKESSSKED